MNVSKKKDKCTRCNNFTESKDVENIEILQLLTKEH